jgi:hypothetical protein
MRRPTVFVRQPPTYAIVSAALLRSTTWRLRGGRAPDRRHVALNADRVEAASSSFCSKRRRVAPASILGTGTARGWLVGPDDHPHGLLDFPAAMGSTCGRLRASYAVIRVGDGVAWHHLSWRPMSVPTRADVRVLDVPERSGYEIRPDGELPAFPSDEYLDLVPGDMRDAFELADYA